jgi:hypothetical protein
MRVHHANNFAPAACAQQTSSRFQPLEMPLDEHDARKRPSGLRADDLRENQRQAAPWEKADVVIGRDPPPPRAVPSMRGGDGHDLIPAATVSERVKLTSRPRCSRTPCRGHRINRCSPTDSRHPRSRTRVVELPCVTTTTGFDLGAGQRHHGGVAEASRRRGARCWAPGLVSLGALRWTQVTAIARLARGVETRLQGGSCSRGRQSSLRC